jgi:class 3 adenylate cyclase
MFLGFRYIQELNGRKRFLLQLQINHLRSSLQDLLDCMIPRNVAERVQRGETVIDTHRHTTVLFCSFPIEASPEANVMRSFLLLDEVHQAFDHLLAQEGSGAFFKVDFVGNDYLVTHPILATGRGCTPEEEEDEANRRAFCASLARLAAQMRSDAQSILADSGLALRFALSSGPAISAVLGESRRHLSVVGEAIDAARALCEAASPWQVLAAGWAAEALHAEGTGLAAAANGAWELACKAGARTAAAAVPPRPRTQLSLTNLTEAVPAAGEAALPVRAAAAELAAAAGRLAGGADAALADAEEERRFLLEAGARFGSGGLDGPGGTAARSACVALSQAVFLLGLPGFDGAGAAAWAEPLRLGLAAAAVGSAVVPGLVAPGLVGPGGQWGAMHAAFLGGCVALAHARAEPFLLLGFALGANLWFIAPPLASAAAARLVLAGGLVLFLGAFAAASRRDGLTQPPLMAVLPACVLVFFVPHWLRRGGQAARVLWLLDGWRRRERAALWAALRDLVPAYVLEGLVQGAQIDPHAKQAVVLQADVQETMSRPASTWGDGQGDVDDTGGRAARLEESRARVVGLHELLTLFDREASRRGRVGSGRAGGGTGSFRSLSLSLSLSLYIYIYI